MEPIDYKAVLADLRRRRDQLNEDLGKMNSTINTIEKIASTSPNSQPQSNSNGAERGQGQFAGMDLRGSAAAYLRQVGSPKPTSEIWEAISRAGATSRAKKPVSSLYSIMHKKPEIFTRMGNLWILTPKRGDDGGGPPSWRS